MMAIKVDDTILMFTIDGLVQLLDNPGACRFHFAVVRVHVVHENCQALCAVPELRWARRAWLRGLDHDPSVAEMHLRATNWPVRLAVTVVLDETERLAQPIDCRDNVLIEDVREHRVDRDGTILHRPPMVQRFG